MPDCRAPSIYPKKGIVVWSPAKTIGPVESCIGAMIEHTSPNRGQLYPPRIYGSPGQLMKSRRMTFGASFGYNAASSLSQYALGSERVDARAAGSPPRNNIRAAGASGGRF